jgi:hypothetical protein
MTWCRPGANLGPTWFRLSFGRINSITGIKADLIRRQSNFSVKFRLQRSILNNMLASLFITF